MTEASANRLRATRAAAEILEQFAITSLPVDIDAMALGLGIPVASEQLPLNIYGATANNGVQSRVLVSTICYSSGHRRFTLAHELGHFCIEGHGEELFARGKELHYSEGSVGGRRDPLEIEADAFATELLMPGLLTKLVAMQHPPDLEMVRAIATAADVSLTAAAIRACDLVDDPFAIVLTLRGEVQWSFFSPGMREHTWARRSFKHSSSPLDSATMRLAKSPATVAACGADSDTVQLSDWFAGAPTVWAGEEALGLGDYGRVLTIVVPESLPTADEAEHDRRQADQSPRDWRDALRPYRWDDPDAPSA